jgi:hypothetical protein
MKEIKEYKEREKIHKKLCERTSMSLMALVHNAGKLKFWGEKKGEKGKKRF